MFVVFALACLYCSHRSKSDSEPEVCCETRLLWHRMLLQLQFTSRK
jgi:hypothetical protein